MRWFVLACLVGCSRNDPRAEWTDEPAPAIDGVAVRRGAHFDLADARGKVVLVSFGYTSCLEVCPTTFATVKSVLRSLGDASSDVQFVYVTVDPERDRPAPFARFLGSVDPRFEGIWAEGDALKTMLDGYRIAVRKRLPDPARYARREVDPSAFYSMDHTSGFWGIDRRGHLRFHALHDATAADLLADTRRLLAEAR